MFADDTNFSKCVHSQNMDTQNISLSYGTREYVYSNSSWTLEGGGHIAECDQIPVWNLSQAVSINIIADFWRGRESGRFW